MRTLIICIALLLGLSQLSAMGSREFVVGDRIKASEITDFYYTVSSSAYPPEYQRYRFHVQDNSYYFFHEKREGEAWPLREKHITQNGTVELSKEQWEAFIESIDGSSVTRRTEDISSGGRNVDTFIYWKADKGKYQKFTFKSQKAQTQFLRLCESLL